MYLPLAACRLPLAASRLPLPASRFPILKHIASLRFLLLIPAFVACSDDKGSTGPAAVANVTIGFARNPMVVGETQRLLATPSDAAGTALSGVSVSWSSTDQAVASVNASGDVVALSAGVTIIIATAGTHADSVTITVNAPTASLVLQVLGSGTVLERYTAEVNVRGQWAYTTTWGRRGNNAGDAVKVWNVSGNSPVLVDSLIVSGATTLGDVQVSDDGSLLVVATERTGGSIVVFSLADPAHPQQLSRFASANTTQGVHTAEVARVNGRPYAFLSVDPSPDPARLVVIDLSDPANPVEVLARVMGGPVIHDVFVRDGRLFTALWNAGLTIWDIGGTNGGSPSNPVELGNVRTVGGAVHNVWWFHDPTNGSKTYAFVGQEGAAVIGSASSGDIHVVDVSDMSNPREVAFYHVVDAGTHNFSVDEASGVLYAAFYNGGVRALDIRGDLGSCTAAQRSADGRCDLGLMGRELARGLVGPQPAFVWGVHHVGTRLFASDMLNGLWVLDASPLQR